MNLRSPDRIRIPTIALACLSATALAAGQPNIVFIHVDDLGWQDTSVPMHDEPTPFNRRYRTPSMQRLADDGAVLTANYAAAPVCTPSRTSLMTGQSPARSHITYWTLHRDRDTSRTHPVLQAPDWNVNGLQKEDVTLPRILRQAGYRTIHVGKAHFGAHGTSGADPKHLGFDVNIAGHASGAPGSYLGIHRFMNSRDPGRFDRTSVWDVPGLDAWHDREVYLTEALTEEAVRELDLALAAETPFFLHFAPYGVHTPIMSNDRYAEHYESLPAREAAYATMIESVDAAVGALLDRLDEHGIGNETIVVFTSDNGGLSAHGRDGPPHTHNAPLRSGKGSAYEGGTRVPGIVRWPGVTEPGTRVDTPIVTHDWFPTLIDAAGANSLISSLHPVDGRNLRDALRGRATDLDDERTILWHQPHQWGARGPGIHPYTAIRRGDMKLIHRHADGGLELYDVANDPGERIERSSLDPERTAAMAALLSETARSREAQPSIDRRTGRPVPWPDEPDDRRPHAPDGMVWIPGGTFLMGADDGYPEERPVHQVTVDGFLMDRHEVTNAQFAEFVEDTGYITYAERPPLAEDYPGVAEDLLVPASAVFASPEAVSDLRDIGQWWSLVPGANWSHPEGPGSTIETRMDHPVVHVAYEDAAAYAKWAGKELPTEAQWEFAARGGLEGRRYAWGDELTPDDRWMTNTWQGRFPVVDEGLDGHRGTAPVGSYPPDARGLVDMTGNVWEWCSDWYSDDWYERSHEPNPKGPASDTIVDRSSPAGHRRVTRGGSHLCSEGFCIRYRPAARMPVTPDSSLSHTGFRCVRSAPSDQEPSGTP